MPFTLNSNTSVPAYLHVFVGVQPVLRKAYRQNGMRNSLTGIELNLKSRAILSSVRWWAIRLPAPHSNEGVLRS
jgi:hypothetical protein